ncbi:MAG TPA: M1 family metallopeptidase, partial [Anaerolineales bacterium]|nr:M1 family metallopeptidase [Anaerolineales bacterium]
MTIQDYYSYTDLEQGRITHIDFDLTIDFERKAITGTSRYDLEPASVGSLFLDIDRINIFEVLAYGARIPFEVDRDDPIRGQRLHLSLPPQTSRFEIHFETSPGASALQWLAPAQTSGGTHPFLFTQCQAIQARSLFPCQDTPSVRFTYKAEIRVQTGLTAVMAAAPRQSESGPEWDTYRFEMPQPVPSYLFALAAARLEGRDLGPRCRVYAEPTLLDAAAWEFATTEESISVAETLLGPYEWDRYDLLVLPPSFPYGGMENPRLNFITPTLLVGDRSLVDVINHELAHAWTGNLVTNATWADFWLNEGWTTYAERRISEVLAGVDYVQLKAAIEREEMYELMNRFGWSSEVTKLSLNLDGQDPNEMLTQIQYTKGCEFLLRLEEACGRAEFDRFIQKYIEDFRFQSITTVQFVEFLRKELPKAATEVDLDLWLGSPGFPESAPPVRSRLKDVVDRQLATYSEGIALKAQDVSGWTTHQIRYFLVKLPKEIPLPDVALLEEIFNLGSSKNAYLLVPFFAVAIQSGYEAVLPRVEQFVATVGRLIFLMPVYRALASTGWSQGQARSLFETTRSRHHPLTVS